MLAIMIAAIAIAACTAAALISIYSVWHLTRRERDVLLSIAAPLSVLKPLCGADEALESNLETFFAQRYPNFELVFGVEFESDPAVAIARRLIARHPEVRARLVVHGWRGLNPKVANLRGMLEAGAYDLVVISDSNVAVGPDYLAKMASRFSGGLGEQKELGLVTSLFAGAGAKTLGARLESLQLNGSIAGGIASSEVLSGCALLVGKSMMFRRSIFERLGGMESLSCVLAEDYVMGRMFREAGYQIHLCADVVENVAARTTLRAFFARQFRWALLRSKIKPLAYPLEILLNPSAVALLAMLCGASPMVLIWAFALTLARDGLQWQRLHGGAGIFAILLGVPKDLAMIACWAAAPFARSVAWRGKRLRVSAGTRVFAGTESL